MPLGFGRSAGCPPKHVNNTPVCREGCRDAAEEDRVADRLVPEAEAYGVEAVLDMMQYEALRRRADSQRGKLFPSLRSSLRLQFRSEMANQVKFVRKKLATIADERNMFWKIGLVW